MKHFPPRLSVLSVLVLLLGACASAPSVNSIQAVSKDADAPYRNILVVSLFEASEVRARLEREIVAQLSARGVKSVALTSLQSTIKPVNREVVVKLVQRNNFDSVLVTQLTNIETDTELKNRKAQASYKFGTTAYFNVYTVEQAEYAEPKFVELTRDVSLQTDLYSASSQQRVWAIGSVVHVKRKLGDMSDLTKATDEAKAIVSAMARDKLIGQ